MADSIPTLSSCCCCISLRMGSIIIGYYYFILGVLSVISFLPNCISFLKAIFTSNKAGETIVRLLVVEYYVVLIVFSICAVAMIQGVKKEASREVRPFVMTGVVFIVNNIFLCLLVSLTPLRTYAENLFQPTLGVAYSSVVLNPAVQILDILIAMYLLLVVYSHYRQMRRDDIGTV